MIHSSAQVKIGIKTESSPGTASSPTVSNYNVKVEGIKYDYPIEFTDQKFATGNSSPFASLPGMAPFKASFKTVVQGSGAAGTAPKNDPLMLALGLKGTNTPSTSQVYTPHTDGWVQPVTIHIAETGEGASPASIRMGGKGCMGNGKFTVDGIGKPMYLEADMQGAAIAPADVAFGSIITPTGFESTIPPTLISATLTAYAETLDLSKFSLDLGSILGVQTSAADGTGILMCTVRDRNAMIQCDPYLTLIATHAHYGRMIAGTTGALSFVMGATAGNIITIAAPAIQIIKAYSRGERDHNATNDMEFKPIRSSGNDEISISFT